MVTIVHTEHLASGAQHAFDVVVRHNVDNHPRYEAEVVEIRSLDDIVGVGHRSVMVRHEHGRTREVVNRCTEYEEGRLAAYVHEIDGPTDFAIRFEFDDDAPGRCHVTTTVTMNPRGALVLMTPLLKLGGPRRSARIAGRMREVVESTPAYA